MMSKPEDIRQEAWDAAESVAIRVQLDVAAGQIWDIRPTIARAIMAAEKRSEEEVAANAHLIAAAPEMLDALKAVRACGNGGAKLSRVASDKTRAAVAKAEGKA